MHVIMNDADYINSVPVNQLRLTPGQRYDILIKGSDAGNSNFPILFSLDENRDWTVGGSSLSWRLNATAWLVGNPSGPRPEFFVEKWMPEDDSLFAPLVAQAPLDDLDEVFRMDFASCHDRYGIPR